MEEKKHKKHKSICVFCNKDYFVSDYRKNSKFCSKDCYTKYQLSDKNSNRKRKTITCLTCGKEHEIHNYLNSRFCSTSCYWNYRRNNPDINIQSNQGIILIDKICLCCGNSYKVHPYRSKESKFCSKNCFNNHRRETIKCPTCKNEVSFPKYENRVYCSEKCAVMGIEKRNSKFSKSIESFLNENKISYKKEYKIKNNKRKYFVDFLINDNLVVECYGDYWHCNPIRFDPEYYHSKLQDYAKNIWEKDKQRIDFIINNNYKVIIIWENNWNNEKNFFEILKNKINEI